MPAPAQIIRAAIETYCPRGAYDTIDQEGAVDALAAGRACMLTIGGYHNQAASTAAYWANKGEPLTEWIARDQGRFARADRRWYESNVLAFLHAINAAGAEQIEAARWYCADMPMAAE